MHTKYLEMLITEAKRLKKINQLENLGLYLFDDDYWGNYEILYLVLDEMNVPPDSVKARDKYNDEYFNFYNYTKEINNKSAVRFINKLKKLKSH